MSRRVARCALWLCLLPLLAAAEEPSGAWTASPLVVSWSVIEWPAACGPRPSGGGEAGGAVTLTPSGRDFRLSGLGRNTSTARCWEQMPGLAPVAHSAGSELVSTTCRMPAGDPRQATVVSTWRRAGDGIHFEESGEYRYVTGDSICAARARRTRVLRRVPETPAELPALEGGSPSAGAQAPAAPGPAATTSAASAASPAAAAPTGQRCRAPGPVARLEITPRTKLLRAGESFVFRAQAYDATGCPLAARPVFAPGEASAPATVAPEGRVTVRADAPTGTLRLRAALGVRTELLGVRVVSAEDFAALEAAGELDAAGNLGAPEPGAPSGQLGLGREEQPRSRRALLAGLGVLVLALGGAALAALWGRRGGRRRKVPTEDDLEDEGDAAPAEAATPREPPSAATTAAAAPLDAQPTERVCPLCGLTYRPDATFCGRDGARLVRRN
jgi:hypothetical protein